MIVHQWWIDIRARVAALFGRRGLKARADEELQFQILGPDRLRLLDLTGGPASPDDARELIASAEFEPFEPHLAMRGMVTYVADQARFTECLSGRD
mgnify:CR=1 FL=1